MEASFYFLSVFASVLLLKEREWADCSFSHMLVFRRSPPTSKVTAQITNSPVRKNLIAKKWFDFDSIFNCVLNAFTPALICVFPCPDNITDHDMQDMLTFLSNKVQATR